MPLDGTELCLISGFARISPTQATTACVEPPAQYTFPRLSMSWPGAPVPIAFEIWLLNTFWVTKES